MTIKGLGYHCHHPEDFFVSRPHGSGNWMLLLILTPAWLVVEGERIEVPEFTAILYRMGTPQIYGARFQFYVNDYIHFEMEEGEEEFFQQLQFPMDTPFLVKNMEEVSDLLQKICLERHSANPYREISMQLYLKLLFTKLAENHCTGLQAADTPYGAELSQLRTEIYSHPQEEWSIDGMAGKLSLSRSYFQHIYRRQFGVSAMQDVLNSRMEYAKYLLYSTDRMVNIISEWCGYKTPVHFLRQFKRVTGQTPTEFRLQSRVSGEGDGSRSSVTDGQGREKV